MLLAPDVGDFDQVPLRYMSGFPQHRCGDRRILVESKLAYGVSRSKRQPGQVAAKLGQRSHLRPLDQPDQNAIEHIDLDRGETTGVGHEQVGYLAENFDPARWRSVVDGVVQLRH